MREPVIERVLVGAALLAASLTAVAADRTAEEWLGRMADAVRTLNYQGTVVYRTGERLDTMRVLHRYTDEGGEEERLVSLTGDAREILRKNGQVMCLLPREQVVMIDERGERALMPQLTEGGLDTLGQHYRFAEGAIDRVADRACQGVSMTPRDAYRFGYQLCIDTATGVPLRIALMDGRRQMLEQFLFTSITFPESIPDAAFQPAIDTSDFRVLRHGADQPGAPSVDDAETARWEITDLPPGFRVAGQSTRLFPGATQPVSHILLTDGLATVSVFAAVSELPTKVFQGVSNIGAVHAYGRMIDAYHVAVVGEVPAQTVEQIGDNLRRVAATP